MKIQDLKRERKTFNDTYAVDYPPPSKEDTAQQTGQAMIIVWGIVAVAGAIISFPHTVGAVMSTVHLEGIIQWVYGGAVFMGVELALIAVAYTEAYNTLETGKRSAPLTARNILRIIGYRLGIASSLPAPIAGDSGRASNGGLLIILFASALLFNQADASQDEGLLTLSKYMAGGIAPLLLLLAGHEFAHALASRLLAEKIANRAYQTRVDEWLANRDEEWRKKSATFTTPSPAKEVGNTVPLANTPPNSYPEWALGDPKSTPMLMKNGE